MPPPQQQTVIDYQEALRRLQVVATTHKNHLKGSHRTQTTRRREAKGNGFQAIRHADLIPLARDIGKICTTVITAPFDIPGFDASAMDGYAICTSLTKDASPSRPTRFKVVGTIVAGEYQRCARTWQEGVDNDLPPCFEIMTGASFPVEYPHLDGVVKVEDVQDDGSTVHWSNKARAHYITVTAPVKPQQHRRPAGSDYQKGEIVLRPGERIEMRHVMALAALGFTSVAEYTHLEASSDRFDSEILDVSQSRLKVGVLSTGSEVIDPRKQLHSDSVTGPGKNGLLLDSNGPYLCNELGRSARIDVSYLGVVGDRKADLNEHLESAAAHAGVDVLILTGGVSKGRCDLTRACIEESFGGEIKFHGVKIRPGAPILFSTVNMSSQDRHAEERGLTIFGLPGNPMAVAAGLQFFVRPFVDFCFGEGDWCHSLATRHTVTPHNTLKIQSLEIRTPEGQPRKKPRGTVAFWLAWRDEKPECGRQTVAEICADQASYKTSALTKSNCWVVVPSDLDAVVSGIRLVTVAH